MFKQILAIASLIGVAFIWGSTFILVKWVVLELNVYYFLFLRFFISFLFLGLFFFKQLLKVDFHLWKISFILSLFVMGAYVFQTEGLRFTTASNSALITGLYMIFVPAFSFLFLKNKPDRFAVFGSLLAMGGLYLLTQYNFGGAHIGDFLTLLCALSWAGYILLLDRYTHRFPLLALVMLQFLFVSLYCAIVAGFQGGFTVEISKLSWVSILITSLLATALAFVIQTWAQRIIDPTRAGILFSLEAVFGVLFAYWLGGEILSLLAVIGACLMVGGMVLSQLPPLLRHVTRNSSKSLLNPS